MEPSSSLCWKPGHTVPAGPSAIRIISQFGVALMLLFYKPVIYANGTNLDEPSYLCSKP